jgi:hypothetical protein
VLVDPPWLAALATAPPPTPHVQAVLDKIALATAPPPTPHVQAVLDKIELEESRREDKVARNFTPRR